jgi:3'-5' exoribonuclease
MSGSTTPSPTGSRSQPAPGASRTQVALLRKGDRIASGVYLVEESNFKQTRNSKFFIQLVLRDRSGSIRGVRWEATQDLYESFSAQDFLRISGRVEEFQGNLQIIVDELARVPPDSVNHEDFLPVSERPAAVMERELLEEVAAVQDPHVKALLMAFLDDPEIRKSIVRCPAGKVLHHACIGGLLEHILSLMSAARLIAKNYPRLRVDILVAAAFLHDIGKIRELTYARAFNYTDEGQLVGHIGIGLLLLAEKARTIPDFPKELLVHLQHIIASHHGLAEHGAIKPPMTPEAIAFHYLDNLDAKLSMLDVLEKELQLSDEATGDDRRWTDFKPSLGRRIYFPA